MIRESIKKHNTIDSIHRIVDEALLKEERPPRNYLGGSQLGEECDRALWYSYHQNKDIESARLLRIFDTGHALEERVVHWLKKSGLTVFDKDANGKQFEFWDGVVSGHPDGVVLGIPGDEKTPYLLEIKSANNSRYKTFVKEGFCSDEKYKVQIHTYMYKFKLKKCLAVILNKNTQELHFEIIEIDEFEAISSLQRGKEITEMKSEPERKYPSKSWFKCQYCNYKKECWE